MFASIISTFKKWEMVPIFAPPAGSDSGLRPPQGQSRSKNRHHLSLNNIHKLAKQITPLRPYLNTISFLYSPYRLTPVFYWNRLRAPSLGGEDRIYYFRATYIHLFWNRTGLFYFPEHPTYVPAKGGGRNQTRPVFPIPIWNLFILTIYDQKRWGYHFFTTLALRSPQGGDSPGRCPSTHMKFVYFS